MSWMKKGMKVVRILKGAGVETASITTIAKVTKKAVRVEDDEREYDGNGRQVDGDDSPFGFSCRLIQLEGQD